MTALGRLRICCASLACCAVAASSAQDYPARPLRLVVPYAAGGSTDVLARMVGQKLTAALGQAVVIDNRTGAGTIIATEIVARAAPDGYTLLMATPPLTVAPALYEKLPFDVVRDFTAITNIAATSNVLVVHPAVPAQTVRELVALAKAHPGTYTFGSSGVGGASHLAVELFRSMAGIELVHVPYKGGSLAVTDLLGGRLTLMFANLTTVQKPYQDGPRARARHRHRATLAGRAGGCRPWQRPACRAMKPITGTAWWRRPPRRAR